MYRSGANRLPRDPVKQSREIYVGSARAYRHRTLSGGRDCALTAHCAAPGAATRSELRWSVQSCADRPWNGRCKTAGHPITSGSHGSTLRAPPGPRRTVRPGSTRLEFAVRQRGVAAAHRPRHHAAGGHPVRAVAWRAFSRNRRRRPAAGGPPGADPSWIRRPRSRCDRRVRETRKIGAHRRRTRLVWRCSADADHSATAGGGIDQSEHSADRDAIAPQRHGCRAGCRPDCVEYVLATPGRLRSALGATPAARVRVSRLRRRRHAAAAAAGGGR